MSKQSGAFSVRAPLGASLVVGEIRREPYQGQAVPDDLVSRRAEDQMGESSSATESP
jgi:hypothetical protein